MFFRRGIGTGRGWTGLTVLVAIAGRLLAAEPSPGMRDTLVFKDGDRVHGTLVEQTAEKIVFRTERFGELRVKTGDAVVIHAEKRAAPATIARTEAPKPAPPAAPPVVQPDVAARKAAIAAAEKADEERLSLWDRFSPSVLTARVRNYFGPWHGRLAFSTELVTDTAQRNNSSYEAHLLRKWKRDEVQLNARYDYSEADNVTTTDVLKLWGLYRREFNQRFFALYRPTSEWNRESRFRGLPNDYFLLQQELGAGFQLVTKPSRKLRAGLSQNLFDTWNTAPGANHSSRGVVSSFEEAELALPWRITVTQRGVWYPIREQRDGWENRFEVNKKLTETLSTSVRHEIRRHNPDGTAQDYDRLKLLFGLDF